MHWRVDTKKKNNDLADPKSEKKRQLYTSFRIQIKDRRAATVRRRHEIVFAFNRRTTRRFSRSRLWSVRIGRDQFIDQWRSTPAIRARNNRGRLPRRAAPCRRREVPRRSRNENSANAQFPASCWHRIDTFSILTPTTIIPPIIKM